MSYLIAGVGAFLTLLTYLWRRSVSKADAVIDDLTAHLKEERDKLYDVIARKNKYIAELEEALMGFADPVDILNGLFGPDETEGRPSN